MNSSIELTKQIVAVIGYLAWPICVLLIMYIIRKELKLIINSISNRIVDPTTDILIGKDGLHIKREIEATKAKLQTMEDEQKEFLPKRWR